MIRSGHRIAREERGGQGGTSLVEALAVLLILGLAVGAGAAGIQSGLRQARLRAAARRMSVLVRWMRSEAVRGRRSVGIVFRRAADGTYRFDLHRDGDGDGIRSRDIGSGTDPRFAGPFSLRREFPGIGFGLLDRDRIPAVPPSRGSVGNRSDPIRFGRSDIVSFSPRGQSSSGTMYLTDGRRRMAAVVVYGPTVRVRVWIWRDPAGCWEQ